MRALIASLLMTTAATAEIVEVPTDKSVDEATAALVAAVEGAGAKVFAIVDHDAGADSIGVQMDDTHLVVFGNPKVGTPAIDAYRLTGLALPLHVLIYAHPEGGVRLAYEAPAPRLAGLAGEDLPGEVLTPMQNALAALTAKAAE
ncbi:MAG: DUF302 domain-containing protein [Pseudomonadota bacterium]